MEENEVSKKAARRKRQRERQKEKLKILKALKEPEDNLNMEGEIKMSKEQILAARKAKKANKKVKTPTDNAQPPSSQTTVLPSKANNPPKTIDVPKVAEIETDQVQSDNKPKKEAEKSREQVMAEREAKKLAKQAAKKKTSDGDDAMKNTAHKQQQENQQSIDNKNPTMKDKPVKTNSDMDLAQKMENLHISDVKVSDNQIEKENKPQTDDQNIMKKSKPTSKAERRALQEAQRAQKAKLLEEKTKTSSNAVKKPSEAKEKKPKQEILKISNTSSTGVISQKSTALHKVRLFKHLYTEKCDLNIKVNSRLHPAIIKLGTQYANNTIVGCNSRCYAFLNAMQILIRDFVTPSEKVFSRALESEIQMAVEFLHKCRPLAVSVSNALKYIKLIVSQENSLDSDDQKKERIIEKIETYAHEQIETAARSISLKVREKISDDDVILTFGCSSLIKRTLIESWKCGEKKFSVVVVDSRPDHEGQEMLESLAREGICCTYVLINAISFIMPKVTKVLLGAHALLANGYVMSRVGTAQISMVASFYNVPVLVCCETHKFSERVQTDSFVYNEIGDPNALVINKNSMKPYEYLKDWQSTTHLTPLNLRYDITPPELVTVVVTEVALLPCTSVQVILRVKPSE